MNQAEARVAADYISRARERGGIGSDAGESLHRPPGYSNLAAIRTILYNAFHFNVFFVEATLGI